MAHNWGVRNTVFPEIDIILASLFRETGRAVACELIH